MSDADDADNNSGYVSAWMRPPVVDERRAFDRVVFHVAAALELPDGNTVAGEIVNVSLVGFLFVPSEPIVHRGAAALAIGEEVKDLKINIVDTSTVGLHLETYPGETDIRDLVLTHPSMARLFLPYIYNYADEDD